jgi:SPP1 gp7 family putative phage head morphogenesis protein
MEYFDKVITQELYFDRLDAKENNEFELLLFFVVGLLQSGKSIKYIKREIRKKQLNKGLEKKLQKIIEKQGEIITGSKINFDLNQESIAGLTFNELIKDRSRAMKARAIKFMDKASQLQKENKSIKTELENEVKRQKRADQQFWSGNTKAGREYYYQVNDKQDLDKIRGWISIAVLDNRTSPICMGLHNRFYSKKEYSQRSDIPNLPPRHPNCRSIVITVFKDHNITAYKGQKLETFLRRNPKTAREVMGIEKYRLWSTGKAKVDKYIDLKGSRFYTNKEIIKRLGISSEKRLGKI